MSNITIRGISFYLASLLFLLALLQIAGCKNKDYAKKALEQRGIVFSDDSFLQEVREGNRDNVEMFTKAGIDINARAGDGCTALMVASERLDIEMARLLIENGADVNARDVDGYTALMYVSYEGNLEIAKLLVKNGADVNARDNDSWTALRFALLGGKTHLADYLRKNGAGE